MEDYKLFMEEILKNAIIIQEDENGNAEGVSEDKPKNEAEKVSKEIIDFFDLFKDEPSKNTFAYVYYTSPVRLNKFIVDENGEKVPNPLYGKLFKNNLFLFNFGETYTEAVRRKSGDESFVPEKRKGEFQKFTGYDLILAGKSGLYMPINAKDAKSSYSVLEDDGWKEIDKETVYKYLPKRKPSANKYDINHKLLILDRIAKIAAGGKVWKNPHFKYVYLGPGKI
jgi:hypothetical protein